MKLFLLRVLPVVIALSSVQIFSDTSSEKLKNTSQNYKTLKTAGIGIGAILLTVGVIASAYYMYKNFKLNDYINVVVSSLKNTTSSIVGDSLPLVLSNPLPEVTVNKPINANAIETLKKIIMSSTSKAALTVPMTIEDWDSMIKEISIGAPAEEAKKINDWYAWYKSSSSSEVAKSLASYIKDLGSVINLGQTELIKQINDFVDKTSVPNPDAAKKVVTMVSTVIQDSTNTAISTAQQVANG